MPELSNAHESAKLEDSVFTVITASDMEAASSYSTSNADKDSRSFLVKIWNTIKQNNLKNIRVVLREALARESKEAKF
jgi:hypothetical protein